MRKIEYFLYFLIVIAAIALRLYKIQSPIADWHSWRQVDTAAVARNFLKFGVDPMRPRFDDLSNIPSGHDNPIGYRMVEFPSYQLEAATLANGFPQQRIEIWLRILSIGASVGTLLLIGLIVRIWVDRLTGIIASFVYAILPYNIYYGRAILPDVQMVFWALLSVYLLLIATNKVGKSSWILFGLSAIAGSIALLSKPVGIFLLFPVFYVFLSRLSFGSLIGLSVYWTISLLPVLWWREWIRQFPEGIPVYSWLFNEGNIRFKGAWWYWLFSQRIGSLLLGYWGLIPFGLGLIVKPTHKEGWFFRWWIVGAFVYLVVIARGNVQHDYYQILISPVLCIYVAKGLVFLLRNKTEHISTLGGKLLGLVSIILALAFSWYTVRTFYWINRMEIVDVGKIANSLLPKNAKVIAPYNGDTTFLYQINRQGWPIGFDIDKKITLGATHYVTLSPTDADTETRDLAQMYTVLVRNEKYAIIDLTKPKVKTLR